MRTINTLLVITAIALTGCTTTGQHPTKTANHLIQRESVTQLTRDSYPTKSPSSISLFTKDNSPNAAYRVIGIAKVSKYNFIGIKRHDATIDSMMKKLAASIGGDGIIDVNHTDHDIEAKVIAYQKILI